MRVLTGARAPCCVVSADVTARIALSRGGLVKVGIGAPEADRGERGGGNRATKRSPVGCVADIKHRHWKPFFGGDESRLRETARGELGGRRGEATDSEVEARISPEEETPASCNLYFFLPGGTRVHIWPKGVK